MFHGQGWGVKGKQGRAADEPVGVGYSVRIVLSHALSEGPFRKCSRGNLHRGPKSANFLRRCCFLICELSGPSVELLG